MRRGIDHTISSARSAQASQGYISTSNEANEDAEIQTLPAATSVDETRKPVGYKRRSQTIISRQRRSSYPSQTLRCFILWFCGHTHGQECWRCVSIAPGAHFVQPQLGYDNLVPVFAFASADDLDDVPVVTSATLLWKLLDNKEPVRLSCGKGYQRCHRCNPLQV